jgi:hypothetical protein
MCRFRRQGCRRSIGGRNRRIIGIRRGRIHN